MIPIRLWSTVVSHDLIPFGRIQIILTRVVVTGVSRSDLQQSRPPYFLPGYFNCLMNSITPRTSRSRRSPLNVGMIGSYPCTTCVCGSRIDSRI